MFSRKKKSAIFFKKEQQIETDANDLHLELFLSQRVAHLLFLNGFMNTKVLLLLALSFLLLNLGCRLYFLLSFFLKS